MSSRGRAPVLLLAILGAAVQAAAMTSAPAAATDTQIQYLSGTGPTDAVAWDFLCTGGRRRGVWTKIPVPSCWEQQGFGTYYYGTWRRGRPDGDPQIPREEGRYRTGFTVPAAWRGRVVRLVFDGVMTDAEVWINGRAAGPVHQGGFYRFHYDITPLVKFGAANRLEVTVSKESADPGVNRAERRGDYWTFGGIFRPVWLEARPAASIDWTGIDATADGGFRAEVHLGAPAAAAGEVAAQIVDGAGVPVGARLGARFRAGDTTVSVRGRCDGIVPWTAETPHLYRARFTLSIAGAGDPGHPPVPVHTVTVRFGFRTFEVRPGDGLYLNGRKIVLQGICRHCFWPETGRTLSREQSYADVRLIQEMNMNAVRCTHYPPDESFLEACDELGLYVLDELAGWQGSYDTAAAARLTGELVRRDVNHPAILFWDNGNEGGWNPANDGEFAKWDPQQRPVLHPWALHGGVNTKHYPDYALTEKLAAGPDLFMPTEFLHGLYDGGIGAGFEDYWKVMSRSPTCAGGFFWVFADEGVVRTDENGRLDTSGSDAPDGVLGPHHEREGSFDTVRQIWSPVQLDAPAELPADWDGALGVANRYDFTNLDRTSFAWSLVRLPGAAQPEARTVLASGELRGPPVPPHGAGRLVLPLPDGWRGDGAGGPNVVYVTARNAAGRELWTWSWPLRPVTAAEPAAAAPAGAAAVPAVRDEGGLLVVRAGAAEYRFDRETGRLAAVRVGGHGFPLGNGPRFLAYRRHERDFADVAGPSRLTRLAAHADGADTVVEADYDGALRRVRWRLAPDGGARLDYDYAFEGAVDLLGVEFDYPEAAMRSIRWLGWGPYRVWQNRMLGTRLDVWRNAYNDTTPTRSWIFPEFKGYFRGWRWAVFRTADGDVTLENGADGGFLGVYRPNDGPDRPILRLPATGIALLEVIPAMGTKFTPPDVLGPESQPRLVAGTHHGAVVLRFAAP
jgi:Glycosyl hydrolases family 2, TIM barrel domain/Glycosyl hydrolases family 2, sugar binding domain